MEARRTRSGDSGSKMTQNKQTVRESRVSEEGSSSDSDSESGMEVKETFLKKMSQIDDEALTDSDDDSDSGDTGPEPNENDILPASMEARRTRDSSSKIIQNEHTVRESPASGEGSSPDSDSESDMEDEESQRFMKVAKEISSQINEELTGSSSDDDSDTGPDPDKNGNDIPSGSVEAKRTCSRDFGSKMTQNEHTVRESQASDSDGESDMEVEERFMKVATEISSQIDEELTDSDSDDDSDTGSDSDKNENDIFFVSRKGGESDGPVKTKGKSQSDKKAGKVERKKQKGSFKLASTLASTLNTKDIYVNVNAFTKPVLRKKPTSMESKELQKIMKKSVIGEGFEKQHAILPYKEGLQSLKKQRKAEREKTKGRGWFDLPAPEMTEEMKNNLTVLKMRKVLDKKHFYKASDDTKALPKYFQMGRVVESAAEFYSSRIPKKERKATLVDELLADAEFRRSNKKKYAEIIETTKRRSGKAKHMKRLKKRKR